MLNPGVLAVLVADSDVEIGSKHICEVCGDINLIEENTTRSVCSRGDHYRIKFLTGTPSENAAREKENQEYLEKEAIAEKEEDQRVKDLAEATAELTQAERDELDMFGDELSAKSVVEILEKKKWREWKERVAAVAKEKRKPSIKEMRFELIKDMKNCPKCNCVIHDLLEIVGNGLDEPFMCRACRRTIIGGKENTQRKTKAELKAERMPVDGICAYCNEKNEGGWIYTTEPVKCRKCFNKDQRG